MTVEMAPKRRSFSVEDKLKILSEIDRSPKRKLSHWAQVFNLPLSTIATFLSKRKVIEEYAKKIQGRLTYRTKWKASPFENIEMVLLEWIKQCSALNVPVNGCLIKEKALLIGRKFGLTQFAASNGWLDGFKHRYSVVYNVKKSTQYSDPSMTASEWMSEKLLQMTEGYESRDIYNSDETGLLYNILIEGSCFDMEDYQNSDDRDDRLTVLLCTNSEGSDKLPPLIIGKANPPNGFENLKTLPCKYVKNQNAWLTSTIFHDYLNYIDCEMKAAGRKILLFIDHCAAHPPHTSLKNIKVLFFPSCCLEEVQPLSVGVINNFKQGYRRTFDHNIELMKERHGSSSQKVELVEALQFVVLSWEEVNPALIRNCFIRAGFPLLNIDDDVYSSEDDSLVTEKTIDPKNKIPTCGVLTIDEICDQALSNKKDSDKSETVTCDVDVSLEDNKTENFLGAEYEVDEMNASGSKAFSLENFQKGAEHATAQSVVKLMEDGENENDKNPPDFEQALNGFKKYKKYVYSFNIDEDMRNTLLIMEIALYKLHNREMLRCQVDSIEDQAS